MAVKATASITVSFERDIISVTWYYKLQASTASPPAKPTAATPSGWTTTEPTYTEGSTNSLYVCQKTTFSDGTFSYSDVSLSSSYEAAKTAYNKGVAALTAATEMGVEYIVGTQTATTGSWTGATAESTLRTGKTISYKLPYAGSGSASLTLTLADGTDTAAIPIYTGTTRVTTHFGAGSVIKMTYDGQYWRADSIPNTNNVDRTQYGVALAASEAIAAGRIAVRGTGGKLRLLDDTTAFDISCPPLYVETAYTAANVTAAATRVTNYSYWGTAFKLTNTHAVAGAAAGKAVYIVGTLSGTTFTPNSTVLTCTVPTSADGLYYMRLGMMSTAANAVLEANHPVYIYYNGKFQTVEEAAKAEAASALTAANGKNKNYYLPSSSTPTGAVAGDQWYQTDKGFELYRYNGTSWVKVGLSSAVFSTVVSGGASIGYIDSLLIYKDEDNYWNLSGADVTIGSGAEAVTFDANTLKTSHLVATEDVTVIGGSGSIIRIPTRDGFSAAYTELAEGGLTNVSVYGYKTVTTKFPSDSDETILWAIQEYSGATTLESVELTMDALRYDIYDENYTFDHHRAYYGGDSMQLYDGVASSPVFFLQGSLKQAMLGSAANKVSLSLNGNNLDNLGEGSYPTQAYHNGACAVYTYESTMCKYMSFAVNPTSKILYVYGSNNAASLSYIGRVQLI